MTDRPIGYVVAEQVPVCTHRDRTTEVRCGLPATFHMLVREPGLGLAALTTCDRHADVARRYFGYVTEHVFAGFCGLPATMWDFQANRCVIDDSGQEPAYGEMFALRKVAA